MEVLKLKNEIPFISSIDDLNSFLYNRFNNSFKVKCEIVLCNKENRDYGEIRKFFSKEKLNNYFINDIVFIEENSNKFDKVKILKEIKKDYYLVFPILNKNFELVGLFYVGKKLLNDAYYSNEVDALRDFVDFLSGHLKYIRMYDRINDLNINLDKMIDDKTMQYNTLLNRQKDFISLISHEIKGPIGSAIFQVDSLLDDINDNSKIKTSYIKGELDLLNQQLLNVGELANRIFSIEKYDIGNISLLKEKLKINDLIFSEVEMYKKNNENIKITFEFDDKIRFVTLDKVQIIQVVNNLINNAIKFSSNGNSTPEVIVLTYKNGDYFYLEVHDNGTEFEYTNVSKFFDKYTTGKGSSIGLGMGLYLCKRIVELHDGFILAEVSEKLGGAKFLIKLPL
ncbi:MAG: HAMP domain-containing sensor histidine kinase [Candidatus Gracilibacteria bacterium]|nr:HAMP domain-containing sensor histidine kinase [Candidatus Gracilibacteria bacterium]